MAHEDQNNSMEAVYNYITQHTQTHNMPPSMRQLSDKFDISLLRACRCIDHLEAQGQLNYQLN
jgi:hypothetical protein